MGDDATPEAKVALDHDLQALTSQLEAAQARESAQPKGVPPGAAPQDQTVFGYTPGALFLGLVISTAGIGYIRYAKVTSRLSPLVVGVALLGLAFLVKDAWILLGSSVGVVAVSLLLRRFVTY